MSDEKYRVLILDDDYELGEMLREFLQNTRQCNVTYVMTEADFWECLTLDTFDILFLDYKLPDSNGLDILARMGQVGYNIPTVMMTGEGSENIAARAIQSGALDYLVKGEYSFSALPPLIHKAVRLREMQRAMQQYLDQVRYQALLLDNMRDAVVVWGLDGIITYWNAAAEQLYGAPASDRLGQRVHDAYFSRFEPQLTFSDLIRSGNFQLEHRYRLPSEEVIWVSAHITTLNNEGTTGDPIGYMNVARDVTPRKLEQEALIKSQHFVQRILDTSPNIIYIIDLHENRIRYINPEVRTILGYPVDEFINAPLSSFTSRIHPGDRDTMNQHIQDLLSIEDGSVVETEYRFCSGSEEWRWLKARETVFSRSPAGQTAEIIGVIQDITSNKQAEEKLQRRLESEKLLSTISSNFINLPGQEIDAGIVEALRQVASFIQVDFAILLLIEDGQLAPRYKCTVKPNPTRPLTPLQMRINAKETPWLINNLDQQKTVVLDRLDDLPVEAVEDRQAIQSWEMQSIVLLPMIYNNALYGGLGFGTGLRDLNWTEDDVYVLKTFGELITNALIHKQVDQALRMSEARYRAIVEEHQTEMICRFLPDSQLTFVNEAYCKYYQMERSLLIGTSFLSPIFGEDAVPVMDALAGLSTAQPVRSFEHRIQAQGGEIRWLEWVSRAIFDEHNDFIEFQAVGRDITQRKKMEEQIKAAQTHLTQAARLASIGELASGVAHQISNPLTTIIADAQILSQQLGAEHPARESSDAIIEAGWRAQRVINELMKFSQPAQTLRERISINDTIDAALLLASAHIQAFGVQLKINLELGLPPITANPRQLTDLWVNLLLLARSSFTDGCTHTIQVRSRKSSRGNTIQVELTDDGIPIPTEQYDRIFEPQLIPSGSGRGTGIELSICREIVRQNRGEIAVIGNGKETTFRIIFKVEGN